MTNLSERLQLLQAEQSVLKKDIAKSIGVSVMGYYRYETGERQPTADIIIKLANFFQVSADYLLGLSETKERQP